MRGVIFHVTKCNADAGNALHTRMTPHLEQQTQQTSQYPVNSHTLPDIFNQEGKLKPLRRIMQLHK